MLSFNTTKTPSRNTMEEVARALNEMKYEELLKMGEQLRDLVSSNIQSEITLNKLQAHDWVALMHSWTKMCLSPKVINTTSVPSNNTSLSFDRKVNNNDPNVTMASGGIELDAKMKENSYKTYNPYTS